MTMRSLRNVLTAVLATLAGGLAACTEQGPPTFQGWVEAESPSPPAQSLHRGAGVVLVVEDREEVRVLACRMLEALGYQALAAANGAEALAVARRHEHSIPLVLTDVIMPGMNGRQLADQLQRDYPGMRAVFMSGYSDRVLTNTGTLDSRTPYLKKPFTMSQLADILRRVTETGQ